MCTSFWTSCNIYVNQDNALVWAPGEYRWEYSCIMGKTVNFTFVCGMRVVAGPSKIEGNRAKTSLINISDGL